MGLSTLDCLFFLPSPRNFFAQLVTLPSTLSNPLANTFPVLLKIPGSKHIYNHFHSNLVVNDHCAALTQGIAIELAVMGTVNRKGGALKV